MLPLQFIIGILIGAVGWKFLGNALEPRIKKLLMPRAKPVDWEPTRFRQAKDFKEVKEVKEKKSKLRCNHCGYLIPKERYLDHLKYVHEINLVEWAKREGLIK